MELQRYLATIEEEFPHLNDLFLLYKEMLTYSSYVLLVSAHYDVKISQYQAWCRIHSSGADLAFIHANTIARHYLGFGEVHLSFSSSLRCPWSHNLFLLQDSSDCLVEVDCAKELEQIDRHLKADSVKSNLFEDLIPLVEEVLTPHFAKWMKSGD